jgi:hypothetical protein
MDAEGSMLYVLCASTVLAGAAGLAAVGVVIGVLPWDTLADDVAANPFIFAMVAGAILFAIAMVQIGLTAIVVGTLGLRLAWRDEDRKDGDRKGGPARQQTATPVKPAEPSLSRRVPSDPSP